MELCDEIKNVVNRFTTCANDDITRGLFEGCENPNDPDEIGKIADWIETESPSEWDVTHEWADELATALRNAANSISNRAAPVSGHGAV